MKYIGDLILEARYDNREIGWTEITREVNTKFKEEFTVPGISDHCKAEGIGCGYRKIKRKLTKEEKKARLEFAEKMLKKGKAYWKRIFFSDETTINPFHPKANKR